MPKEFKNDYGSFEERLKVFVKPTHWEIDHGIEIVKQEIIDIDLNLKLVIVEKSDNTNTLIIFYNGSKNSHACWFGWMPSKEQINAFPKIKEIYDQIDEENFINKNIYK